VSLASAPGAPDADYIDATNNNHGLGGGREFLPAWGLRAGQTKERSASPQP